jgi:hypothetical protein
MTLFNSSFQVSPNSSVPDPTRASSHILHWARLLTKFVLRAIGNMRMGSSIADTLQHELLRAFSNCPSMLFESFTESNGE